MQMLAVALDRKGTPLQVWYVDPNAAFIDQDQAPNPGDQTGRSVGKRAQLAVRDALKKVHNDSVVVMPGKKGQFVDHDFIPQSSNAGDFIDTLNYLDTRILRALLIPALVFSAGDGTGSFALGQEHAKTFDKILDGMLGGFVQTLLRQLVRELIAYNFPKEQWEEHGLGEFSKRELSIEEREKEWTVVDGAINQGVINMNDLTDLNQAREIAGFGPRTEVMPEEVTDDLEDEDEETDDDDGDKEPNEPKEKKEKKLSYKQATTAHEMENAIRSQLSGTGRIYTNASGKICIYDSEDEVINNIKEEVEGLISRGKIKGTVTISKTDGVVFTPKL
jgi:hypothetical protein